MKKYETDQKNNEREKARDELDQLQLFTRFGNLPGMIPWTSGQHVTMPCFSQLPLVHGTALARCRYSGPTVH